MVLSATYPRLENKNKESSLKDLLLVPRKPAVMGSSYMKSVVTSTPNKSMNKLPQFSAVKSESGLHLKHKAVHTLRERSVSENQATSRPGSAPTMEQVKSDWLTTAIITENGSNDDIHDRDINMKHEASELSDDHKRASASSTPISVGLETFSPIVDRWQDNESPSLSDVHQSSEIPSAKRRKSSHSNSSDVTLCENGQPMDLSSKPKTVNYDHFTKNNEKIFHCVASQCELLKPEAHQAPITEPEVTSSSLTYRCPFCSITFEDEVLFSIHMGCHSLNEPFLCNVCGKRTLNKYAFYTHIMRGHSYSF